MGHQDLRKELARVYALLPRPHAEAAVRSTLRQIALAADGGSPVLKWADFSNGARFLRGGVSSVANFMTLQIARPANDKDIARLCATVEMDGAQPGRMIYQPAHDCFFWFVPVTTYGTTPRGVTRGFIVDERLFKEIAHHFNAGAGLTPAEMRALFQLTAGAGPNEAAAIDKVSTETKRAQIKSVALKLQCGGQTDLVRLMIGQLTHLLSISDGEVSQTSVAERFTAEHLAADMRLRVVRLDDGRILRCIDAGPEDGTPIVAVHGMMFGMLLRGASEHLHRNRLRLFTPLRPGYLDARPALGAFSEGDLIAAAEQDVLATIDIFAKRPAHVLGHSLGALIALGLATRYPQAVSRLTLVSANLPRKPSVPESGAGQLYGAYSTLNDAHSLTRLITSEYRQYYANVGVCRDILRGMFGASATDLAALEPDGVTVERAYRWFMDIYSTSVAGISEDFRLSLSQEASNFVNCPLPVQTQFVHGTQDPLTDASVIAGWAASNPSSTATTIAGGGHFISTSHAEEVWRTVGNSDC